MSNPGGAHHNRAYRTERPTYICVPAGVTVKRMASGALLLMNDSSSEINVSFHAVEVDETRPGPAAEG